MIDRWEKYYIHVGPSSFRCPRKQERALTYLQNKQSSRCRGAERKDQVKKRKKKQSRVGQSNVTSTLFIIGKHPTSQEAEAVEHILFYKDRK